MLVADASSAPVGSSVTIRTVSADETDVEVVMSVSGATRALVLFRKLRPAGSDPEVACQKISFLKVSVSLGGFGPSVAHGKHSARRRCVQATKTRQKLAFSLTPLGAVRAAAEGTGYKNRRLGKSRGVRFDSRLV